MQANGVSEKVTMDKSGANKATIDEINASRDIPMVVRQVKYLNNIVEQDHRAVKRITKPMLGFKSFQSAKNILAGVELMHMIRKGQMMMEGAGQMSFAVHKNCISSDLILQTVSEVVETKLLCFLIGDVSQSK